MNVNRPAIPHYPAGLPDPKIAGYSGGIDYGVIRSEAQGFPDQGRTNGANSTIIQMSFGMNSSELQQWSAFMDANSGGWITLPVVNQYPLLSFDTPIHDDIFRMAGSYQVQPAGANYFIVTAAFEGFPRDIHDNKAGTGGDVEAPPDATAYDWIIGGTPPAPSPDWMIAGSPSSPSQDLNNAGAPADHI